ncbi:MAG: hypothetical protein IKC26_09550 [Clostridia bacterium]|nr:hypothetical protein [Clostridia bacterium]
MIREGRALGMPDGDVLLYAKISARTGVRVTFDKGKTLIGRRKGTRELVYADGFYDPATNEICVNPDGKRSAEKLLIHELAHAIYGNAKGMRLAIRNTRNLSMEEREEISRRYAEVGRTNKIELLDEYNAHYAEGILGNAATLERLLDDAPTVKDRILDFLRGAKGDTDAQRSAAARRLFYRYKRLFDRFAQQNAQNIAAERLPTVATDTEKKTPHGEALEASGVTNTQELSVKRKDAAYLDAVSRGDVEAAQRMVDEAADKAGYTVDAYHGTDADFTVFDKNSVGKGADEYGAGFYFAKQRAYSSEFGKNVYKVRLKIENPIKLHRTPGGGGTLYDVKITPEQAYKILKKHPMMFDKTDSPLAGRFDEYRKVGAKKWMVRELATSYKSLGVLCDKYFGIFKDYPNEFHEAVRDVLGYDGVEVYNDPEVRSLESGDYFYVAWFDDQMKSADPIVRDDNGNVIPLSERFNEKKNDIRYAMPEDIQKKTPHGEAPEANGVTRTNNKKMQVSGKKYAAGIGAYSYESLTKKNELSVVELPSEIPRTVDGKIDNKAIVAQGKLNARKQNNPKNTGTDTYVRVDDIGLDVLLGTKGLQHGLVRSEETALAVMKIGDILKGSVAVNELNGNGSRKTDMSYVLLGACRDGENLFVVRSVVSKLQNDVTKIDVYQLSAVKGKKTETPNSALKRGAAVTEQGSLISSGSPTVSIADFLQYVKDIPLINEILSEDVAKKLGVTRTNGTLTGDIRFALPEDSDSADVMAEFSKELKGQLNEEADRESEIDLARAKVEDAAAKEISRVKKREAKRADYWKEKAKENESRAKVLGNISVLAQKMKDLKLGTYHNATQDQSKQFAGSVEGLSRIVWNGNLSVKLARKHIGTLRAWYKQDNPILCYQDKENPGYYNAEIAEMLTGIADGEGGEENFFRKILRKTEIHLDKRSVLWYNNNRDTGLAKTYGSHGHRGRTPYRRKAQELPEIPPFSTAWGSGVFCAFCIPEIFSKFSQKNWSLYEFLYYCKKAHCRGAL